MYTFVVTEHKKYLAFEPILNNFFSVQQVDVQRQQEDGGPHPGRHSVLQKPMQGAYIV